MSTTATTPANKTLAEQFPLAAKQIATELHAARQRVEILERVEQEFDEANELVPQFEVVVSPSHPSHLSGKSIGTDLESCLLDARKMAKRSGIAHAFVNLRSGISVSLNPGDGPLSALSGIHQQKEERSSRPRIVWRRNERGSQ